MKKTYRSLFCLLAVLLLSVSALPSASALFSKKLYYYGVVEASAAPWKARWSLFW